MLLTASLLTSSGSFSVVCQASALFVKELDGISMVVTAMKQFTEDAPLQRRCCMLLAHFGKQDDFRADIQKAKVGSLVGAALDHHPEDAKLAASVYDFFHAMCR